MSKSLKDICNNLLNNNKIRYIAILNKMGNLIVEKEREGLCLSMSDSKIRSLYLKSVLDILLKKDFDHQIGLLKYNTSHREKMSVITIPFFDNVIIITVEPNENCDLIAKDAINVFEKFYNEL